MDFRFIIYMWLSLGIVLFCYGWLYPYCKTKIALFYYSFVVKRMAKNNSGESRRKLEELSEMLKQAAKEEKL